MAVGELARTRVVCPVCGRPPDTAGPAGYTCTRGHSWPREREQREALRAAAARRCDFAAPEAPAFSTWADGAAVVGRITWHWPRWLSPGFLHLLCAYTGEGKSTLALRIAATYILGWPWPDGTPFGAECGPVLWGESEGAQSLNYDRALTWGIPLDKLRHPLPDPFTAVNLTSPRHREAMLAAAADPDVRLIVLDSLSAARPGRDENDSRCIADMQWLAALARDTGKPVLALHHLRKRNLLDVDRVTLDRLRGSSGIPQLARVVWALSIPDRDHPERLRLECIKNNLSKFPAPLGMTIDDKGVVFGEPPRPPLRLTEAQLAVLSALSDLGEARSDMVARIIGGNRGSVHRRLKALVVAGAVKTRTLNTVEVYALTDFGRACLEGDGQ